LRRELLDHVIGLASASETGSLVSETGSLVDNSTCTTREQSSPAKPSWTAEARWLAKGNSS
jgi:hypothetical protein